MAKKTDQGDDFRIRPSRPHSGGKSEARAWSTALRTLFRYAGTSRRSKAPTNSGSGGSSRRQFNHRCAVRTMYTVNKTAGQWKALGRYIARESAGGAAQGQVIRDGENRAVHYADKPEDFETSGKTIQFILTPTQGQELAKELNRMVNDIVSSRPNTLPN